MADEVSSTTGIIRLASQSEADAIIIATEVGVVERLRKECGRDNFYSLGSAKVCPNMKMTRLSDVYNALLYNQNQIEVPYETAQKARQALERMLEVR